MFIKALTADNLNQLLKQANIQGIEKENVLTVLYTPSGYSLIYFSE